MLAVVQVTSNDALVTQASLTYMVIAVVSGVLGIPTAVAGVYALATRKKRDAKKVKELEQERQSKVLSRALMWYSGVRENESFNDEAVISAPAQLHALTKTVGQIQASQLLSNAKLDEIGKIVMGNGSGVNLGARMERLDAKLDEHAENDNQIQGQIFAVLTKQNVQTALDKVETKTALDVAVANVKSAIEIKESKA